MEQTDDSQASSSNNNTGVRSKISRLFGRKQSSDSQFKLQVANQGHRGAIKNSPQIQKNKIRELATTTATGGTGEQEHLFEESKEERSPSEDFNQEVEVEVVIETIGADDVDNHFDRRSIMNQKALVSNIHGRSVSSNGSNKANSKENVSSFLTEGEK